MPILEGLDPGDTAEDTSFERAEALRQTALAPEPVEEPILPTDDPASPTRPRSEPTATPDEPVPVTPDVPANIPGVLSGGNLVNVRRQEGDDLWFIQYEFPVGSGQFFTYQFAGLEQVQAALGEDFAISGQWTVQIADESYLTDPDVNIVDSAVDVIGLEGSFTSLATDAIRVTALENGVRDPGIIGRFLSDPEIGLILAAGSMGDWSDARIQAEIRRTDYYQNVLYPGIDTFLQRGAADPEGEWARYSANVSAGLQELGVEPDPDGSYRQTIGELLTAGVDDAVFLQSVPTFIRASQSTSYREALNAHTQAELGTSVTFDDVYDVLSGEPPEEIRETIERANLAFHANQRLLGIDPATIERIALETDLSESDIAANFTNVELSLLALGNAGLRRSGLTASQIAQSAFSLPDRDLGGLTALEIQQKVRKFAIETGLMDDPKLQLFVGFGDDGTPLRPGLGRLTPEGA
jgi:hypothetical protein